MAAVGFFFTFLLLALSSPPASAAALHSDAASLLALRSSLDPHGLLRLPASGSHCRWPGVVCSPAPQVSRLVFESLPLSGTLPSPFPELDQLRLLSLKNTSLGGRLPDLSSLRNLKSLFLSHNLLTGPLPASLRLLPRLRSLDLSHNLLSGQIPVSLSQLRFLSVLRLDSNNLSGPVPTFPQPSLRLLNLSSNNLSGPLPATAFPPSSFSLNPLLCGARINRPCPLNSPPFFFPLLTPPSSASSSSSSAAADLQQIRLPGPSPTAPPDRRRTAAVAAVIAAAALVALAGLVLAARRKAHATGARKGAEAAAAAADAMEEGGGGVLGSSELAVAAGATTEEKVRRMGKSGCLVFCAGEVGVYTLEELMRASAELLGRGTVGTTYKAVLDGRLILGVKRVDSARMAAAGREEFAGQMEVVGRLRHPNIVPLRAYFQAKEERLLVYDFQPNGSLFSLIHGSRSTRAKPLHWTSCLKIAEDVAQGLAYIHQASRLVHGNIKSSNVLLGSDFEACLTDCCLATLVEPLESEEESGYRAPEARNSNRKLTPKSDIYAFGILLLEILTGKPPLPHQFLVATDLPVWVRSVREDDGCEEERLTMLLDIARECIKLAPESRPSTWQVLKMIQEVKDSDVAEEVDIGMP